MHTSCCNCKDNKTILGFMYINITIYIKEQIVALHYIQLLTLVLHYKYC